MKWCLCSHGSISKCVHIFVQVKSEQLLCESVELRVYINHSIEKVKEDSIQKTDEIRFKMPSE